MIDTSAIRNRLMFLAISGKLVKQNVDEGCAGELIANLLFETNNKSLCSNINPDEIPYEIPDNWMWCRLSDIGTTNIGLTYHPEDVGIEGVPVLRSNNIKNNRMFFEDLIKVKCEIREKQFINKNDILICARNGSKALVGKCAIYNGELGDASFGAFMAVYRTPCYEYVYYYFQTKIFRRYFENENNKQINQVTQTILKDAIIPLPPIEEQRRIVAKLKESFTILDEIDELQSAYVSDNEILRRKLIDAGLQGKLTERLSGDGTAEELFAEIQIEKQKLIKEKKIKKEKVLADISEEEIPFEIPSSWKWIRLNDIGSWSAGATPSRRNKSYYSGDIPWVKTGELNNDVIKQTEECISELALQECSVRLNPIGTVLIAMYGATIGKVSILDIEATTNQACCACITYRGIYNKYLFYYLISHKRDFISRSHGGAQPNISKDIIINELFPLPPYEEQVRIVSKLDELLRLI